YWHNGECHKIKKPYFKRIWVNHGGKRRRYWKKISSRSIRRYPGGISRGGNYRKIFDYQWMID
ncbi:MAG: hypothetical protein K2N63_12155, partial [Lachnospiraceae bacterium]|nr:hypothetical protein [Lachnospiraceae bacterium]